VDEPATSPVLKTVLLKSAAVDICHCAAACCAPSRCTYGVAVSVGVNDVLVAPCAGVTFPGVPNDLPLSAKLSVPDPFVTMACPFVPSDVGKFSTPKKLVRLAS